MTDNVDYAMINGMIYNVALKRFAKILIFELH